MRQKFSTHWISSRQTRKQRKYRHNAPLHIKHRFVTANLSRDLRKKYGKRNLEIRKGDEALVMRGNFAKKRGKILAVDLKRERVTIDGISRKKGDGTKVNVYFNPSNLQLHSLNIEDKRRIGEKREKQAKETKENASNKS